VKTQRFDIAIGGAGIVGLCVAALFGSRGYRMALIDPAAPQYHLGAPYDLRTYALTPASMRVLGAVGAHAALDRARIAPFAAMSVWDAASTGRLTFTAASLGRERLASLVEHDNLMVALNAVCSGRGDLTRVAGMVTEIVQEPAAVHLRLDSGATIEAALFIGCAGGDSRLGELVGIETRSQSFEQSAVVCNVEMADVHDFVARQRFLPSGPLALLPLPEPHTCAVVWSTSPEQAQYAVDAPDDTFVALLTECFGAAPGAIRSSTRRLSFPLRSLSAEHYYRERTVLLGDAAHVVHPLAGQGLNLGIMDAAALAEVFDPRDELNLQFPRAALRRFERMRRAENMLMLQLTDRLNALFRDDGRFLRSLRGGGMKFVDRIQPLKHWLMLRAMGDVGDVPEIAAFGGARTGQRQRTG